MPTWTQEDRHEVFTPAADSDDDKLTISYNDGRQVDLKGEAARMNRSDPQGKAYQEKNPLLAQQLKINGPADYRATDAYNAGKAVRNFFTDDKSVYNRILSQGPLVGGTVGGTVGLLGGVLANWLSDEATKHMGFGRRNFDYRLLGTLLGAGLGGVGGYYRTKSAAMFVDPRNFILEKLQSANDVSMSDKVRIAAAVRGMSTYEADRLAKQLRSMLGFGVGAAIARALGMSLGGALIGGIAGVLGAGLLNSIKNRYF